LSIDVIASWVSIYINGLNKMNNITILIYLIEIKYT